MAFKNIYKRFLFHFTPKSIINPVSAQKGDDYISLTDIARYKNKNEPKDIVKNWMRSKSTIEFLGLWEKLNNPDFKVVEFDPFKKWASKFLLETNTNICNQKLFL